MKTGLIKLVEKWKSELGSYIPNTPIYNSFINEAEKYFKKDKKSHLKFADYLLKMPNRILESKTTSEHFDEFISSETKNEP